MMQPATSNPSWDPQQYQRFADHRMRPGLDLLARVAVQNPSCIYDLGCGPGELTRHIAERWPGASVVGLDSSAAMLDAASRISSRVFWELGDIQTWNPKNSPALIFSNATLQWLPNHAELFPRLLSLVAAGGCFAVQMPANFDAPSHTLMRDVLIAQGAGSSRLHTFLRDRALLAPGVYYDLMRRSSVEVDIWATEYQHVLRGSDPVLEWVRGTGLRPVLEDLAEPARREFLDEYRRQLREAYPERSDGSVLFPFRRIFMVAVKS